MTTQERERVALYLWRREAAELRRRASAAGLSVVDYVRAVLVFTDCATCGHERGNHWTLRERCSVCACERYTPGSTQGGRPVTEPAAPGDQKGIPASGS